MLKPDTLDENDGKQTQKGVFLTTLVAFFIAEVGDKTQIATVALAAGYSNLFAVVAGTTCGMLAANAPWSSLAMPLLAAFRCARSTTPPPSCCSVSVQSSSCARYTIGPDVSLAIGSDRIVDSLPESCRSPPARESRCRKYRPPPAIAGQNRAPDFGRIRQLRVGSYL